MRIIFAFAALCLAASAWSDDQATLSFSGKGKSGIEVRDSKGEVKQVVGTTTLRLNQIPPDAAAREEAYRAKQKEAAANFAKKRAEITVVDQKAAAEADAAAKRADMEAAAAATAQAKKFEEEHPRKVRRTTVRGTRYVPKPGEAPNDAATPPASDSAADQPPAPRSADKP